MAEPHLQDLARRAIAAFNRSDWPAIRALTSENCIYLETGRGVVGVDAVIKALTQWKATAPDVTGQVLRILTSDDTTATELIWRGTHTGPLHTTNGALPPSGQPFQARATMWQQWQHNKVIEQHHHLDLLSTPHQINAAPTPAQHEKQLPPRAMAAGGSILSSSGKRRVLWQFRQVLGPDVASPAQ